MYYVIYYILLYYIW